MSEQTDVPDVPEEQQKPITTADVDVPDYEHVYPDPDAVISTNTVDAIPEDQWGGNLPEQPAPEKTTTKKASSS